MRMQNREDVDDDDDDDVCLCVCIRCTLSMCKHWGRMWMSEDTVVRSPSCCLAAAVIKDAAHSV